MILLLLVIVMTETLCIPLVSWMKVAISTFHGVHNEFTTLCVYVYNCITVPNALATLIKCNYGCSFTYCQ